MSASQDRVLQGRYRLEKLIGESSVHAAWDTQADVRVAVKEFTVDHLARSDRVAAARRFAAAAQIWTALRHPGLTAVSDYFETRSRYYLVMEFVGGVSMECRLKSERKPFPVRLALLWMYHVAKVLDYLHTRSPPVNCTVVRPPGILVTREGHVKLIDFGLSRTLYRAAVQDPNLETIQSDVNALASTLYTLLTLQTSTDPEGYLGRQRVVPIREWNAAVSVPLASLIEELMVSKGPTTVLQAAEDLLTMSGVPNTASPDDLIQDSRQRWWRMTPPYVPPVWASPPEPRFEAVASSMPGDTHGLARQLAVAMAAEPAPEVASPQLEQQFEQALGRAYQALRGRDPARCAEYVRQARAVPGFERAAEALALWGQLHQHMRQTSVANAWEWRRLGAGCGCLQAGGELAATGELEGSRIQVWDLRREECLYTVESVNRIAAIALSPDGQMAAVGGSYGATSGSSAALELFKVSDGSRLCVLPCAGVRSLSFSPDSRQVLVVHMNGTLSWWDVAKGCRVDTLEGDRTHTAARFSPDGTGCISACRLGICWWDLARGKMDLCHRFETVLSFDVSTDGGLLLAAEAGTSFRGRLTLQEVRTKTNRWIKEGAFASAARLTSDGRHAVTAGKTIQIWSTDSGQLVHTLPSKTPIQSVSLGQDARFMLSAGPTDILVWMLDWNLELR